MTRSMRRRGRRRRKRIKHVKIENETERNKKFEKRAEGLVKKAHQLSILCGVNIAVVAHKQEEEGKNAIMWPSPAQFNHQLLKFLDRPAPELAKKMVTHEKYVEQTLHAETDNLWKDNKRVIIKGANQLLNKLTSASPPSIESLHGLNLYALNGLKLLADDMLEALEKRRSQFSKNPTTQPNDALKRLWQSAQHGGRGLYGYSGMRPEQSAVAATPTAMARFHPMMRNHLGPSQAGFSGGGGQAGFSGGGRGVNNY